MSPQLKEFRKNAGLLVLTIWVAAAVFLSVMYSEQKSQDRDLAQLKAKCETIGIKTSGNGARETN